MVKRLTEGWKSGRGLLVDDGAFGMDAEKRWVAVVVFCSKVQYMLRLLRKKMVVVD